METRPTLRRLVVFEAAIRLGSIGAAAREVGLSQPAATHALARLEAGLGVRLIERDPRGSLPNAAGRILHRRAARMLRRMEEALDEVHPGRAAARLRHVTDRELRALLAIDAAGAFRAAAALLAIAEPSLHRAARDLEAIVGVPLYARGPQGLGVSPAGAALAAAWRLAQAEIGQGLDELAAASGAASGRLALGCLPLMPKTLLARAVGALLRVHPDAAISLEESSHETLMARLRTGDIDMLLGALRPAEAAARTHQRVLFPDPYVVVAGRHHPLAGAGPVDGAALATFPWVIPWRATPRREVLEGLFARLPRRPLVVLETSSVPMMGATLAESDCVSLMSRSQIRDDPAAANLAILDCPIASFERSCGIVTRAEWLPTAMQARFIDILQE